jgi:hypothetical protein
VESSVIKVFLSYSRKDRGAALELSEALAKKSFDVWNGTVLEPGENWYEKAGKALKDSDALVVFVSPDAMASPQVRSDIQFALKNEKFKGRLIPVIVKETKRMPWILEDMAPIAYEGDIGKLQTKIVSRLAHDSKGIVHAASSPKVS